MEKKSGFFARNGKSKKQDQVEVANDYSLINVSTPTAPVLRGSDFFPQVVACLIVSAIFVQTGVNLSYSAVLLPQLMSAESELRITQDEASWIASIVSISTTVGCLLSGPIMDKIGRKTTSELSSIPLVVSWLIIAYVKNIYGLYIGRLLAGLGTGVATSSLVYVSEVSHPRWRPTMMCFISIFTSLGILFICVLCQWLDYDQMALCFAAMSLASCVMMVPLPESPQWLLRFRTQKRASDALKWLYRREECYQHELKSLLESYKLTSTSALQRKPNLLTEYKKRSTLKPLVILMLLFVFQQLSGGYVVIFYAVNFLQLAGGKFGSGLSAYGALVMLGAIRFGMSFVTAIVSRRCGRRPLCIISGLGMALSTLIAAIFINTSGDSGNLFLKLSTQTETPHFDVTTENSSVWSSYGELSGQNSSFTLMGDYRSTTTEIVPLLDGEGEGEDQWVPVVCVLVYVLFSSLGVLIIPWNLTGELLPLTVRGSGGGFINAFANVAMFATVKAFPYLLEVFKTQGMFCVFTVTSLMWVGFVYIFLPETRGKSSVEIDAYFE